MELRILTVPECPHAPVLDERLAEVLAGRPGVSVVRQTITDDGEATRSGMRGSPTLLIDGVDPFADPAVPPSVSCRMYRDFEGRVEGVPSVAALRRALETAGKPVEPWSDPLGRAGAGRVAPAGGGLRAVQLRVLRSFATTGRPPSAAELASAAAPFGAEAGGVLADLHAADYLRLDAAGRIRAAYPFSASGTAHVVDIAGGPRVYAMCAVDALGIAAMLRTPVTVRSTDPATSDPVTVAVPAEGGPAVWEPATAVVLAGRRADCAPCPDPATTQPTATQPAADVCCGYVNFFATEASAAAWAEAHPEVTGQILAQPDAEHLGAQIFGPLLT